MVTMDEYVRSEWQWFVKNVTWYWYFCNMFSELSWSHHYFTKYVYVSLTPTSYWCLLPCCLIDPRPGCENMKLQEWTEVPDHPLGFEQIPLVILQPTTLLHHHHHHHYLSMSWDTLGRATSDKMLHNYMVGLIFRPKSNSFSEKGLGDLEEEVNIKFDTW